MNFVAKVLAQLAESYFKSVTSGGVECRIVIPGLTPTIVEDLHLKMRSAAMPSLLVVPADVPPSERDARLRPEGLTSLRYGNMIIAVWPGELSRIQDSIVGAGGAVRNFAFSDEWPWIDNGNEHFKFDGPFLSAMLDVWEVPTSDRSWFRTAVLAVRKATLGSVWRREILLDEVLGTFSNTSFPELPTLREKFLRHCGLPCPAEGKTAADWEIGEVLEQTEDVCGSIANARAQVETRSEVLERVDELSLDPEARSNLRRDINSLLDGLASQSERHQVGVLTLRGCWGDDAGLWRTLSLPVLRRLFDPTAELTVTLTVRLVALSGVVAADEKQAVLFEGGSLELGISYDGIPVDDGDASSIVVRQGARDLWSVQCSAGRDSVSCLLPFEDIFGSGTKKRPLRVQVRIGNRVVTERRIQIYPCGTNSPLLVILQPGFDVHVADEHVDDDTTVQRVETASPLSVTILTSNSLREISADLDGDPVEVVPDATEPRILAIEHVIDPASEASGRVRLTVESEAVIVELDLETSGQDRGEFTIEREFLARIAEGSTARVERLVAVFTGTAKQPYGGLGGLTDASRARSRYARIFEAPGSKGLPILADLLMEVPDSDPEQQGWVIANKNVVAGRLRQFNPRTEVQELLGKYEKARRTVLDSVMQGASSPDGRWPAYAWFPIYVERWRGKTEIALVEYLDAYIAILTFLESSKSTLSWEEVFLLSAVDMVVHWADDKCSTKVFLVGPWHPLVVAKRFLLQATLLASGRRLVTKQSGGFNQLVMLLDQLNSFRWLHLLRSDAVAFDNAYVSSTSDPGWLFGIDGEEIEEQLAERIVISVRWHLGLEAGVLPIAREQMSSSYLRDFHNAYPSRRALSLAAAPLYAGERIVESANSVLYSSDESASQFGRLLSGGIHLFLHDSQQIEQAPWREPPICIYEAAESTRWAEGHRDIYLLPPGKPRISRVGSSEPLLPRGKGDLAIFCAPVRRISVGAHGIPSSVAYERDTTSSVGLSLGDVFVRALHASSSLSGAPLCAGWSIELPETLKFLWNIIPGGQIDPAVLVEYVRQGYGAGGQPRVLWDYSMSLTGAANSFYVLSQVPASVTAALSGSPVLAGRDVAREMVRELAEIGLAIGGESMRSGSKALGVIGFVAAIRLFSQSCEGVSPLSNTARARGFLLPVDSFQQILGDGLDEKDEADGRRADLIACQLMLDEAAGLKIGFAAIECKYTSHTFSDEHCGWALQQASRTYERLRRLTEAAKAPSGTPERLALLSLITFGLRLGPVTEETQAAEYEVLRAILSGEFEIVAPEATSLVVVTECEGTTASVVRREGLVVKLTPGHWPGVSESEELRFVRKTICQLFSSLKPPVVSTSPVADPFVPVSTAPVGETAVLVSTTDDGPERVNPVQETAVLPQKPSETLPRLSAVLLGTNWDRNAIFYDPQSEKRPLDNYNMMVTGSSGKGKTQLIKALVAQLRKQNRNVLLLDFKNDFASDRNFLSISNLDCRYVTFDGLPYNPLIPMPVTHPNTGKAVLQLSQHLSGIASILATTFGLGAQQEAAVKEVLRECFRDRGFDPARTIDYDSQAIFPDFNDVGERIRAVNPLAYNRMDPLFDLGVFSSSSRNITFEAVLRSSSVIDLSQIQSDAIKNAIAKVLVLSAHAYYNARPHSGVLRQFFVFDEAHRVLDSEFLVRFVRECRAYGVGILLSSQYPTDFPQEVSASLNTKILHGNGTERERVKDIARTLGTSADESAIAKLELFQAFVSSPHYDAVQMRTLAYPHYLVWEAIRKEGNVRRDSIGVDGIDRNRLSLDFLVNALLEMGLVQEQQGLVQLREFANR